MCLWGYLAILRNTVCKFNTQSRQHERSMAMLQQYTPICMYHIKIMLFSTLIWVLTLGDSECTMTCSE